MRRYSQSSLEAFWGQVDKSGSCWIWQGPVANGYGLASYEGKKWRAHRLAYTLMWGGVPQGQPLDHLCRNTLCVHPMHLEPVTGSENSRRAAISRRCEPKRRVGSRVANQEARRQAWYADWLASFKPVFVTNLGSLDEPFSLPSGE